MEYNYERMTLTVFLTGDLDLGVCSSLRQEIKDLLKENYTDRLILDVSAVNFIDSTGLGMILDFYKMMGKSGGRILVCGAKATVKNIFILAGMTFLLSEGGHLYG